jgi:acetyl-CoA acetyltransferase
MARPASALSAVAIAGLGITRQARHIDETDNLGIALEAAELALADAGLTRHDIDGISARWHGPGGTTLHPGSPDWAGLLGIRIDWIGDSYPFGVPGVLDAASAIATGLCHTVLITGGSAGVRRADASAGRVAAYTRPGNEFTEPYGSFTAAQFALVAQRYLQKFPHARRAMAEVAALIRNNGHRNPAAVMAGRGPYTPEDILAAPTIVEPFTLLELCLANEGGAALVLTTLERARDCPKPPVVIMGGGMEWVRQQYVDPPRYEEVWNIGARAAKRAFDMAGVTHRDIDVFEAYDVTSYEVLRQFEAIGFCSEGEGADFVRQTGVALDGGLPICTDGGLMSFSHNGWGSPTVKVLRAAQQVRGECGEFQVPDVEIALCAGAGSGAQYYNLLLLGRDR